MKPTLNDIAKRTGLSVATVSRALHRADSPNVSRETRERVHSIARELGYRPNLLSRSLATGRTHTVSYWTFDPFAPFYANVARAVCDEAARRGYFVHVHNTMQSSPGAEPGRAGGVGGGAALALSFDGIIACDVGYLGVEYAAHLSRPGVPLVGIGINFPPDCDRVAIDQEHGTNLAMDHLLELGCRRIAHMGHRIALQRGECRARVYDARMRAAGLEPEYIPVREHRRQDARAAAFDHVREHGAPEAIFCVNDEVAIGCYRGLADLGVEVPSEVRLVGCDGMLEAEYQRCPITTIATPVAEMCRLAWNFLEARIEEPGRPLQQALLKPELIVRESTTGRAAGLPE
jgi:LacI family transcriptional regulator